MSEDGIELNLRFVFFLESFLLSLFLVVLHCGMFVGEFKKANWFRACKCNSFITLSNNRFFFRKFQILTNLFKLMNRSVWFSLVCFNHFLLFILSNQCFKKKTGVNLLWEEEEIFVYRDNQKNDSIKRSNGILWVLVIVKDGFDFLVK